MLNGRSKEKLKHMDPNSAPGMDGFTVSWVREFWDDLEYVCKATPNKSHAKGMLSELLKTTIMKILMKGAMKLKTNKPPQHIL